MSVHTIDSVQEKVYVNSIELLLGQIVAVRIPVLGFISWALSTRLIMSVQRWQALGFQALLRSQARKQHLNLSKSLL